MSRADLSRLEASALTPDVTSVLPPLPQPQGLRGQYLEPLRSPKGKIKGLVLHSLEGPLAVKLPKYLRPMLLRELTPGQWVQVWAVREGDRWRAINLHPWPETAVPDDLKAALAQVSRSSVGTQGPGWASPASTPSPVCIRVCRKGKCFRQGGLQVWQALQAEVNANPSLHHVTLEATGCMNACKQGPNLQILPQKKMHSRITPDRALNLLAEFAAPGMDSPNQGSLGEDM